MTGPPRVRLLVSDVDGTLVTNDKVLTPRARSAAAQLHAAGVLFTLTSSRPPRGLAMLTAPLALTLPLAGFNGGVFARPDLTILSTLRIGRDLAEEAGRLFESFGLDVWVYTAERWYVPAPTASHVARESFILQFPPDILGDWRQAPLDDAVKIVGVSDLHDRVAEAEGAAQAAFAARASATRSAAHFIDLTHPKANKGAVVEFLSRELAIAPGEIATIGDMPNDVLMFERSGWSIAMGNASEAVKSKARSTTASNEAEGFALAVEGLLAALKA